ncbi:hypothetical protein GRF59_04520 [Paenibacillus sp. HJL G12]|uniref:DUF4433 domain-containing protein n=1 Tax=Paenibacillus dendrobii TaxID=2691084 RepID=A0A7X3IFD9_9BACL|nr:hypothetical protein [Paenibacillus dendrobii]MWV42884.1 hypothetical protein [Paenibacillus dendrobii]
MRSKEDVIQSITPTHNRKFLYHFTRVRNLQAIAHLDSLLSSYSIHPYCTGERRTKPKEVNYGKYPVTINAHLRIPEHMMEAGCTLEEFRSFLDKHVFFWPTMKDCQKMMETYSRREPDENFAVLVLDAFSLLMENFSHVSLSKYDSGSSPRFPKHCTYRKSPEMFVALDDFKIKLNKTVPVKASEVREVLIEAKVTDISRVLRMIYVEDPEMLPVHWKQMARPMTDFNNGSVIDRLPADMLPIGESDGLL